MTCYRAKDEFEKTAIRRVTNGSKPEHGLKRELAQWQIEAGLAKVLQEDAAFERVTAGFEALKKAFGMGQCRCCWVGLNFVEPNEYGDVFCPQCEFSVVRCGQCCVHKNNIYPEVSAGVPAFPIEQMPEWLVKKPRSLTAKQLAVIEANRVFVQNEDKEKEQAAELAAYKEKKAAERKHLRELAAKDELDTEKDE